MTVHRLECQECDLAAYGDRKSALSEYGIYHEHPCHLKEFPSYDRMHDKTDHTTKIEVTLYGDEDSETYGFYNMERRDAIKAAIDLYPFVIESLEVDVDTE